MSITKFISKTFTNSKGIIFNVEEVKIDFPDGVWDIIKEYMIDTNPLNKKYSVHRYTLEKDDLLSMMYEDCSKKIKNFIKTLNEEDYVECYSIGLFNKCPTEYDDLWLIDINDDGFAPYVRQNINTSSRYSMWKCGICGDEQCDVMTLENICDIVGPIFRKGLKKVLLEYKEREDKNLY